MINPQDFLNALLDAGENTLQFPSVRDAKRYRFMCYAIRRKAQAQSRRSFVPGEPGYNVSPWDGLVFLLDDSTLRVVQIEDAFDGENT
mgnify:FL=1